MNLVHFIGSRRSNVSFMCKIISRINDNWQSYLSQAVLVSKLPYRYKARNKKAPTIGWNFVSCDLICRFSIPFPITSPISPSSPAAIQSTSQSPGQYCAQFLKVSARRLFLSLVRSVSSLGLSISISTGFSIKTTCATILISQPKSDRIGPFSYSCQVCYFSPLTPASPTDTVIAHLPRSPWLPRRSSPTPTFRRIIPRRTFTWSFTTRSTTRRLLLTSIRTFNNSSNLSPFAC